MFDRGKPKEATSPTSPDKKMSPTQGSYMNNEQFCLSPLLLHFAHFLFSCAFPCLSIQMSADYCLLSLVQLRTSEIFATTEAAGLVVRGLNLHLLLQSPVMALSASPTMAALHWVPLAVLPSARPTATP